MAQESSGLTAKQERAAVLVAEDELTDEDIAAECSVSRATIARWKRDPEFDSRVRDIIDDFARNMQRYHIARRDKRVAALNERWCRLQQVIDERANDGTMPRKVPGASTGIIVRTLKGKDADVEEFVVDTGILSELRALEKQAAQEVGQWTEKSEQKVDQNVTFTINFERTDDHV